MLQWKRFQFFDSSEAKDANSTTPVRINPKKYNLSCATSGHGTFVFGGLGSEHEGSLYLVHRDFSETEIRVFDRRVLHVQQIPAHNVLVLVGEDDGPEPGQSIILWKVWSLEKNTPLRVQKIFPSKFPEAEVTAFRALEDMSQIAVGLANGAVILFRGDLMRDKQLPLQNKIKLLCEPGPSKVTGLHFRGTGKSAILFVVTSTSVCSYATGSRTDVETKLNEDLGAEVNCSTLSSDQDLVVGRQEAVYFYMSDEPGPCYGLDGVKTIVAWFRGYLVVVSPADSNASTASRITIHDLKNKFVAYTQVLPEIKCVLFEFGCIFVFTEQQQVFQLKEKDTQTKLDTLFKKSHFTIAINLASTQDYDVNQVSEIYKTYGDHLYNKADYDTAVDQYIKTIGRLEPSYVIKQFLDAQRTQNLTQYLEALHAAKPSLATADHTTLLLNCYTKLKDQARLDKFVQDTNLMFDVDTAINVLRQAGYQAHACNLAARNRQHSAYLRIQLEDLKDYTAALQYIETLPFDEAYDAMVKHGKALMGDEDIREQTTALIMSLCSNYDPKHPSVLGASMADDQGRGSAAPFSQPSVGERSVGSTLINLGQNFGQMVTNQVTAAQHSASAFVHKTSPFNTNPTKGPSHIVGQHPHPTSPSTAATQSFEGAPAPQWSSSPDLAANGRPNAEDFIPLFVTQPTWLMVFLEFIVQQNPARASPVIYNTLLELYLRDDDTPTEGRSRVVPDSDTGASGVSESQSRKTLHEKAAELLKNPAAKYDASHAMFLCQVQNFHEGVLYLLEKQRLHSEILNVHMRAKDHTKVFETCDQLFDPDLWIQVLQYFAAEDGEDVTAIIAQVLQRIDQGSHLPPLRVIEILSSNQHVTLSLVKEYILKRLDQEHQETTMDRVEIERLQKETTRMRNEIKELKTSAKIFQSQRCEGCTCPLTLPSVHFLCGHSFDQRCLSDEKECPTCANQNQKYLGMKLNLEQSSQNHDDFLGKLRKAPGNNGFSVIADYFGHGIFHSDLP